MKRIFALVLAVALVFAIAACGKTEEGNKDTTSKTEIADSETLLNNVWGSYAEDEKFAVVGGDMTGDLIDHPAKFPTENAEALDTTLGLPQDSAALIDDAASMIHMMNANTFTSAVYRIKNADDVTNVVDSIKENIKNRQWMCGFPDKLIVITVDNYVVSAFGKEDLINTFKTKTLAAYESATLACEESLL